MSGSIVPVSASNFDEEVSKSPLPVLIDFWAPWCGPCMAVLPTLEAVASLYEDSLKVVKINVDESPDLADPFNIRGIPHMTVVKDGKAIAALHERSRTRLSVSANSVGSQR